MDNPAEKKGGSSKQPSQASQAATAQIKAEDLKPEFYEIELSTQMQTIDGKPLTQTRTEKVEVQKEGETVIEEKELPSEPYRNLEAILITLDSAPADFISRYMEEVKDLYNDCVDFAYSEDKTRKVRVSYDTRQAIPYIGKSTNALTTFLSLQLDSAFEPIAGPVISPIQPGDSSAGAVKVSREPIKA